MRYWYQCASVSALLSGCVWLHLWASFLMSDIVCVLVFVARVWSGWIWRIIRWSPSWPRQQEIVWMRSSANSVPLRCEIKESGTLLMMCPWWRVILKLIFFAGFAAHASYSGWCRSCTREALFEGERWVSGSFIVIIVEGVMSMCQNLTSILYILCKKCLSLGFRKTATEIKVAIIMI